MCLILALSFPSPHVIIIIIIVVIVIYFEYRSLVFPYKQRQGAVLILTFWLQTADIQKKKSSQESFILRITESYSIISTKDE